ncbi:MAG: hypothetical protein M1827_007720 [Pycnora praestabilis]|nr:MAG: hypothetical protein M1827_007720 [Pycnora praestabilis]
MPTRLAAPVLTVDAMKMHKVDTRNVENLFGMWTVFSKCAESMEEGRRLENLSWRLWNRETFCCEPSQQARATTPAIVVTGRPSSTQESDEMPELSASVDSATSDVLERVERDDESRSQPLNIQRPASRKPDSIESRSRGREKHITSFDLEKMVITIKEKKELEPLAPMPIAVPTPFPAPTHTTDTTPRPSSPSPESKTATTTETVGSSGSDSSDSQAVGSESSATSDLSQHSIIRGFSSGHPSSYRSQSRLAPAPVSNPPAHSKVESKVAQDRKKGGMFMLGGSSGEDESSLEEHMAFQPHRSSLSDGLKRPITNRKQTSFKDEVATRTINEGTHEDEEVFESDEEDEDAVSESAIDDDDDSSEWEDSVDASGPSSVEDKQLFQRVDSRPNLTSRRSLLTNLLHQPDRAAALANLASKSTPAMQRSRTTSPNGPSVAASPEEDSGLMMRGQAIPRSKPIIMTTSNIHPPALSPRTTRRNMLATELTESLRRHLLWERQQKSTTANAVLKRRHTAHDVANLQEYPGQKPAQNSKDASKNNSWNHYFDHGLGEYHQKGW